MGLESKKIGVAATRQADAIATLIQKNGGIPSLFSIQGDQQLNDDICEQNIRELLYSNPFDIVLLTTGIGIETLEKTAISMNLHEEFIEKLRNTSLAVRGQKTLNWIKKHSLSVKYVSEDGTMENLLMNIASEGERSGQRVFLQAYNLDDEVLKFKLEEQGYDVYLSKPYSFIAPSPLTVENLQKEISKRTLDAVVFTSKTQVQNLFNDSTHTEEMIRGFNEEVLAVAVGKVTASELEEKGINNLFQPTVQKMGAMIVELREYLK
ncbi:uroporphyrinogen-III synthase [Bacillus sp. B1-b2]|uniref:uroporphyrinogen-III synthase n=1 Tax=Bacillus sp. B1-b2 TaxID=2653201 RepID=UPI00299F8A52|nr:uroporphyrinogen-III synthase [Bacillus sp. B1-b2]